jgi:hypothetical protein
MKRLSTKFTDETMAQLEHIAEVSGKTKTDVLTGMVEHWAAVIADHERRGFYVRPLPGASLAAAMVGDREGLFDETPAPAPIAAAGAAGQARPFPRKWSAPS